MLNLKNYEKIYDLIIIEGIRKMNKTKFKKIKDSLLDSFPWLNSHHPPVIHIYAQTNGLSATFWPLETTISVFLKSDFKYIKVIDAFHLEVTNWNFFHLRDRSSESVRIPVSDYNTYSLYFLKRCVMHVFVVDNLIP